MRPLVTLLSLVLAAGCATQALAAGPWISVPSTPTSDQRMIITGGNLGPSAPLTLRIEHPAGGVSIHPVVADANGKLRFEYTLPAQGGYGIQVTDAAGMTIGGGRLGNFQ